MTFMPYTPVICHGGSNTDPPYREEIPQSDSQPGGGEIISLEYRRYCGPAEGVNSGAQAISLAAESGAEVVVLVGYDCSLQNGLHWHGAHPQALRNPTQVSISKWQQQFLDTRKNTQIYIF